MLVNSERPRVVSEVDPAWSSSIVPHSENHLVLVSLENTMVPYKDEDAETYQRLGKDFLFDPKPIRKLRKGFLHMDASQGENLEETTVYTLATDTTTHWYSGKYLAFLPDVNKIFSTIGKLFANGALLRLQTLLRRRWQADSDTLVASKLTTVHSAPPTNLRKYPRYFMRDIVKLVE